jgi:hypothetical protein
LGVDFRALVTDRTIPAEGPRRVALVVGTFELGDPVERKQNGRSRQPSRLAMQLTEAFAPCAEWSQVRVQRGASGRRTRVIVAAEASAPAVGAAPFDWATGTL